MERRTKFVYVSVLDKPNYDCKGKEVGPFTYGGGTIICGAMAERKTGTAWEQLIQQHIYTPLGMNHSGWGVASPAGLTGPWLHGWDANNLQVTVDEATQQNSANYSSHAPAGNLYCSAADLGLYLQEQLIANPKLTSVEMRHQLQTHQVDSASDYTRGSWESSNPGSDTAELTKNGWWGVSFALVSVDLQAPNCAWGNLDHLRRVQRRCQLTHVRHDASHGRELGWVVRVGSVQSSGKRSPHARGHIVQRR